ncbi:MAG: CPBP family intramembrane metalloprotease [Acidobacteriia bacterium]|nr:CPBP family intramembrane metalloprotease [Terriglobia bacterium]
MSFFFNFADEIRPEFRAILFYVFAFLVLVVSQTVVTLAGVGDGTVYQALVYPLEAIGLFGLSVIGFQEFDHRSSAPLGFRHRRAGILLLEGSVGGIVAVAVVFFGVWFPVREASGLAILPNAVLHREFLLGLFIFFFAAAVEEMGFRGYPFVALRASLRRWGASVILSLLFVASHPNFYHSTVAMLSTFLGGIVFTQFFVLAESLWLPIGFHFGWNVGQALVFPLHGRTATLVTVSNFNPAALGLTEGAEQSWCAATILLGLTVLAEILIRKKKIRPLPVVRRDIR